MIRAAFIGLLAATIGCGSQPPKKPVAVASAIADAGPGDRANDSDAAPAPPPRFTVESPPPGGAGELENATVAARIFAFSDSQLHHVFGKRTFAQSPFADRMAFEVAIRPAAVDDGSDLLLKSFIRDYRNFYSDHSLVFLGDAADLSCTHEYDAFAATIRAQGVLNMMGVMSNHDGFFVGNFTSKKDIDGQLSLTDMPNDWTRACSIPGTFDDHRMSKGLAAERFMTWLGDAPLWATSSAYRTAKGVNDYKKAYLYYVRRLAGGDPGAPPVWGVFLDTVDYRGFDFHSARGAGSVGAVSPRQIRFLDRAMFEAAGTTPGQKPVFVFFGHHPYDSLDKKSRARLKKLWSARTDVVAYITAHHHASGEEIIRLSGGRRLPEIIVGSTTDAPQAARVMQVQVANGKAALATWRVNLTTESLCSGVKPLPPSSLGYTGYRIRRDDTPDVELSTIDKLSYVIGLSDLVAPRIAQAVGAMMVENELVRAMAELYLHAPIKRTTRENARLKDIISRRYAAGNGSAALRPWIRGKANVGTLSAYEEWHDPALKSVLRVAQKGLHNFGSHHEFFKSLRQRRIESPESERYFLCHAIFAAQAEAKRAKRKGGVLYIR
jgi:hypothetical protein